MVHVIISVISIEITKVVIT